MRFQPVKKPLICKPVADQLLEARYQGADKLKASFNLGRSFEEVELYVMASHTLREDLYLFSELLQLGSIHL